MFDGHFHFSFHESSLKQLACFSFGVHIFFLVDFKSSLCMKDIIVGLCKAEKKNPEFSLLLKGKEISATSFFFFRAFPCYN